MTTEPAFDISVRAAPLAPVRAYPLAVARSAWCVGVNIQCVSMCVCVCVCVCARACVLLTPDQHTTIILE